MQLNDLKPAWQQMKLLNGLPPVESGDILSIIESPQNSQRGRLQAVLLNVGMFIIIALCCQGG